MAQYDEVFSNIFPIEPSCRTPKYFTLGLGSSIRNAYKWLARTTSFSYITRFDKMQKRKEKKTNKKLYLQLYIIFFSVTSLFYNHTGSCFDCAHDTRCRQSSRGVTGVPWVPHLGTAGSFLS